MVGEVETCEPLEGSDHLKTTVNVGDEILPIVCGAPNVARDKKSVKVGTTLPEILN